MLSAKTLEELRQLLTSDRVSYKGSELARVAEIVNEIAAALKEAEARS